MCCSSQPSQRERRAAGRSLLTAVMLACVVALALGAVPSAYAQSPLPAPAPSPSPSPTPVPVPTQINSEISTGNQVLNLGSSFLERLGNQATNGFNHSLNNNPAGGGASEAAQGPRYRSWGELYGLSIRTDSQGDIVGDKRRTTGGVFGFGAQVMPHVNIGFSIDQSHTQIDVPLALQTATLDLTQFGFSASVDRGPWTWAIALVHGFGNVGSSRDTGLGFANASYGARIDGALTELDYYWTIGQGRIVPKAGLEWVRSTTGALQEVGGLDPVMATGATFERTRGLVGAEVGHYWIFGTRILDLSAYGKFVDNFEQNFSSVMVSLGPQSITVQGIGESQYGADAGASASLFIGNTARVYLNYDAKLRANLQSHQGTLGLELKF
jgi:uncharacterized protein with beta-barrel porin domain